MDSVARMIGQAHSRERIYVAEANGNWHVAEHQTKGHVIP